MKQSELFNQNPVTSNLIPNAPFNYARSGSKGIMIGIGIMVILYFTIAILGLIYGLGWASLFLPIPIYYLLFSIAMAVIWAYSRLVTWLSK